MHNQVVTVNSRRYDLSIKRSWKCRLIERSDPFLLFVGEFECDVEHPDLGLIKRGTISYEYYWLDRWYNVFRFHEPNGDFRNYYCNINRPPQFGNGVLDYVDLDIDIVVWPDWRYVILDTNEYEQNSEFFNYDSVTRSSVANATRCLIEIIEAHDLP